VSSAFARLPREERALALEEGANRLGISPVILEKDFWVCWVLKLIFDHPEIGPHVVFKGGTSLSKVFGVISRFSEDVDLALSPGRLGFSEDDLNEAPSASQRQKQMRVLGEACARHVEQELGPRLEAAIAATLRAGASPGRRLTYEFDGAAASPALVFAYPSATAQAGGYIRKSVKLEFGSLTDQRPVGSHAIVPLLAGAFADAYDDFSANVVALELERTFWEKATILHAEYHRPADRPGRERFARHYADFAALWTHPSRSVAVARLDILEDVARHKGRFFASGWAHYDTARAGSLRLHPPADRIRELHIDYDKMRPMFLAEPPSFDEILARLAEAERGINAA
jgi:hypothetical protein